MCVCVCEFVCVCVCVCVCAFAGGCMHVCVLFTADSISTCEYKVITNYFVNVQVVITTLLLLDN